LTPLVYLINEMMS